MKGAFDTDRNASPGTPVSEMLVLARPTGTAAARGWTGKHSLTQPRSLLSARPCAGSGAHGVLAGVSFPGGRHHSTGTDSDSHAGKGPRVRTAVPADGGRDGRHTSTHTRLERTGSICKDRNATLRGWGGGGGLAPTQPQHPHAVTGCPGPRPPVPSLACHPRTLPGPTVPGLPEQHGPGSPRPASGAAAAEDWSAPPATSLQRAAQCLPHAWARSPLTPPGGSAGAQARPTAQSHREGRCSSSTYARGGGVNRGGGLMYGRGPTRVPLFKGTAGGSTRGYLNPD